MPPREKPQDSTLDKITASSVVFRDCAASIRSRLLSQRSMLDRLRGELAAMREIAKTPFIETTAHEIIADPAAPVVEILAPAPGTPDFPAPQNTEATAESAIPEPAEPPAPTPPVVVSKAPRSFLSKALPFICLIGASLALVRFRVPGRIAQPKAPAAAPPSAPPAAETNVVDAKAAEALALVQHWSMAGDDKTLFERLGSVIEYPGGVPAWSAELTDENSYLIVFREVAGTPVYAFETDLKSKTVRPTPEAVERLALIRVRDEAAAKLKSL